MHTDNITPTDRNLLALINRIGFGHIENIKLSHGTVTVLPSSRSVQTYKAACDNTARKPATGAFTLKTCQAEFLHRLHTTSNGVIRIISIQDGLPNRYEIEEVLTAI